MLLDQALRDCGARPIEFRSAMGRLAEEHDLGIGKTVEHGTEGFGVVGSRKRFTVLPNHRDCLMNGALRFSFSERETGHDIPHAIAADLPGLSRLSEWGS